MSQSSTILRINASGRREGSFSRILTDELIDKLRTSSPGAQVMTRDLIGEELAFADGSWITANFTADDQRDDDQKRRLSRSDALADEVMSADTLVIGCPIYNFSLPAALKAWIDLVVRPRKTFQYTERGPVGLATGKRAYIVIASGGTAVDSEFDFATGYLRFILGFIGITDVVVIAADRLMSDEAGRLAAARSDIAAAPDASPRAA